MPCYDERSSADYRLSEVLKERRTEQEILRDMTRLANDTKDSLDELTDNVCAMFKKLEKDFTEESFNEVTTPKMRKWWKEHKEADARRKQRG